MKGSVIFLIKCPGLDALNDLWEICENGSLAQLMHKAFITPELKKIYNIIDIKFTVSIKKADYLECWDSITTKGKF